MRKILFPIFFLSLLFPIVSWSAAGIPQNVEDYSIVKVDDHYDITFSIELGIQASLHQTVNNRLFFLVDRKNGDLFEPWEAFERYPISSDAVQEGHLEVRLKLWDIEGSAIENLFEFQIRYDLWGLYNLIPLLVARGAFSPTTSPLLTINLDPCLDVTCSAGRSCVEGDCVCPTGTVYFEDQDACLSEAPPPGSEGPPPPGVGGGGGAGGSQTSSGDGGGLFCQLNSNASIEPSNYGLIGLVLVIISLVGLRKNQKTKTR